MLCTFQTYWPLPRLCVLWPVCGFIQTDDSHSWILCPPVSPAMPSLSLTSQPSSSWLLHVLPSAFSQLLFAVLLTSLCQPSPPSQSLQLLCVHSSNSTSTVDVVGVEVRAIYLTTLECWREERKVGKTGPSRMQRGHTFGVHLPEHWPPWISRHWGNIPEQEQPQRALRKWEPPNKGWPLCSRVSCRARNLNTHRYCCCHPPGWSPWAGVKACVQWLSGWNAEALTGLHWQRWTRCSPLAGWQGMRGCDTWKEKEPGPYIFQGILGGTAGACPPYVLAPAFLEGSGVLVFPRPILWYSEAKPQVCSRPAHNH